MKKRDFFNIGLEYWLQKKQIENVISHVLQIDAKEYLLLEDINPDHLYAIQKAFYELQSWEPEEYVYEQAEFYGRVFKVNKNVLIPRNETELLVSEALKHINSRGNIEETTLLDIGTGSGCIPVSMNLELSPLKLKHTYAIDISKKALDVAHSNRALHNLNDAITQIEGSLLSAFLDADGFEIGKEVVVTANLPYIKDNDFVNMDAAVINFEPSIALYGGEQTGFELYEKLIKQCYAFKKIYEVKKVTLFIEIGFDQYEVSKAFLTDLGLEFEYFQDTNKIQRIIKITNF